jgi:hypothetical protein
MCSSPRRMPFAASARFLLALALAVSWISGAAAGQVTPCSNGAEITREQTRLRVTALTDSILRVGPRRVAADWARWRGRIVDPASPGLQNFADTPA